MRALLPPASQLDLLVWLVQTTPSSCIVAGVPFAEIGLAVNSADPEQASVYFEVSDPDALRADLEAKGIEPSALRMDNYGGSQYRVFFAKEPYGVCFCFGKKQ